jgi:hypothetical protein
MIGLIACALHYEIIIIRLPHQTQTLQPALLKPVNKKTITLYAFLHNQWKQEKQEIMWTSSTATTINYMLSSWLTFIEDEFNTLKKTSIQAISLCPAGNTVYISFDRNPLEKNASTFAKWMWIESLLKTLRENGITVQLVHFLVHHQPLTDPHLDFSFAWPIKGFIE